MSEARVSKDRFLYSIRDFVDVQVQDAPYEIVSSPVSGCFLVYPLDPSSNQVLILDLQSVHLCFRLTEFQLCSDEYMTMHTDEKTSTLPGS